MSDDWDSEDENTDRDKLVDSTTPKFEFKEADASDKKVITIFGLKGDGKTTLAMNPGFFPGIVSCLSFDNKSVLIKNNIYNKDGRIKVYNAIEHYSDDPDDILLAAENTYKYCMFLLEKIKKEKSDWIIIDGLEIFAQIGEMVMRHRQGLKPFQGITNMNVWKVRKLVLRALHKAAIDACKKGVIYTTYTDKDEVIEEGTTKTLDKIPKWVDVIMWQTDIVIYVYGKKTSEGRDFYFDVVTSKINKFMKTGDSRNITRREKLK